MEDESREGIEKTEFCVYENTPTERSTSSYMLQINTDNIGALDYEDQAVGVG
jgi:hypothetical protein